MKFSMPHQELQFVPLTATHECAAGTLFPDFLEIPDSFHGPIHSRNGASGPSGPVPSERDQGPQGNFGLPIKRMMVGNREGWSFSLDLPVWNCAGCVATRGRGPRSPVCGSNRHRVAFLFKGRDPQPEGAIARLMKNLQVRRQPKGKKETGPSLPVGTDGRES